MNNRKLMITAAVACLVFGCDSAHATVIPPGSVSVTYTTGTSNLVGSAPTITNDLASPFTFTTSGLSERNFLTTSPAGSCNWGCVHNNYTSSDQINFNFTITDAYGGTATFSTFATYYAKYFGRSLGCDNNGNSKTDCIIWNGTGGSSSSLGTGFVTDTVDLVANGQADGSVVNLTFYNAHDWTITSEISGTYLYTPPQHQHIPEPTSLVLLASGIAGLQVVRRGLRRKPSKKSAA